MVFRLRYTCKSCNSEFRSTISLTRLTNHPTCQLSASGFGQELSPTPGTWDSGSPSGVWLVYKNVTITPFIQRTSEHASLVYFDNDIIWQINLLLPTSFNAWSYQRFYIEANFHVQILNICTRFTNCWKCIFPKLQ